MKRQGVFDAVAARQRRSASQPERLAESGVVTQSKRQLHAPTLLPIRRGLSAKTSRRGVFRSFLRDLRIAAVTERKSSPFIEPAAPRFHKTSAPPDSDRRTTWSRPDRESSR